MCRNRRKSFGKRFSFAASRLCVRNLAFADDFKQGFEVFLRGFLSRKGAEERREFRHQLLVFQHVGRNPSRIDRGEIESLGTT